MGDCRDFSPYEGIPVFWPAPDLPRFDGSEFDYTGAEPCHELEHVNLRQTTQWLFDNGWHWVTATTNYGRQITGMRRDADQQKPYLRHISILEAWQEELASVPDLPRRDN